jgi:hypothetical protein
MAIVSNRELPRENKFRLGEPRDLTRRIVITHDGTHPTGNELVAALGIELGVAHPEYTANYVVEIDYEENYEGSQYHALVTAKYGVAEGGLEQWVPPLQRPPLWTFTTQGVTVPAFFYYDVPGNNTSTKPLTNSAFDYFEGIQTDEAQTKVVIRQNLATFPSSIATQLTNTINSSSFLGGAAYQWKCQGITGELRFEEFQNVTYRLWAVTVELLYRQTGWQLQLPDVGFNFLGGDPVQKRRAVVFDFENGEWVASPGPVGLDGEGGLTLGAPEILARRVHREVNFNTYFGSPPS